MKSYLVPLLGSWHVLKMANICVWRMALSTFTGPLFHFLFPHAKIKFTPRLIAVTRILSLIRLSYPHFKESLAEHLHNETKADRRQYLRNLQDLCEFFIPAVFLDLFFT